MAELVGAIDQGTTSTRCIVFDRDSRVVAHAQREHRQILPQPGWVEHDPLELLQNTRAVVAAALQGAGLKPRDLTALGIANQRESTVLWDRRTGVPLANAIVWQDTRVEAMVAAFAAEGGADRFRARTGLPLASYFSALKLRWLLDHVPDARAKAEAGDALFGTVDSFLTWHLSGGIHVTDVTNASRTLLMNLATLDWDPDLLAAFGIPTVVLPRIVSSSGVIAELDGVKLAGILGDQQAALVGQACFRPGTVKSTYGTGSFLLMHTGAVPVPSRHGLVTTVAYRFGDQPACYALEGSIAVTGALVQWLRDNLGLIRESAEIETLAEAVPDNGGVYIVPAFSGLYAPHWQARARGVIAGLTRFADRRHIARAALEAAAYQTRDVIVAMSADSGIPIHQLRVDGGMVENGLLMQFQADILDATVIRPTIAETTALGAAYAAGLAVGVWSGTDDLAARWQEARRWTPAMDDTVRDRLLAGWTKAIQRSLDWLD